MIYLALYLIIINMFMPIISTSSWTEEEKEKSCKYYIFNAAARHPDQLQQAIAECHEYIDEGIIIAFEKNDIKALKQIVLAEDYREIAEKNKRNRLKKNRLERFLEDHHSAITHGATAILFTFIGFVGCVYGESKK